MSLYIDQKYLSLISNKLPLFKKKKDHTYNCRCIICGDSAKKKNKARGYFFSHKTNMFYKCFNCDVSMQFATFLKKLDETIYNEYRMESYSDKNIGNVNTMVFEQPKFKSKPQKLLDDIVVSLSELDKEHEAVKFANSRNIPVNKFKDIYYIDEIKKIVKLNSDYETSIRSTEPRLVFPFYDEDKNLTAVTCRAIRGEALRYITVKLHDDKPLIYNLNSIDPQKIVYVVEGPIDSLFIDNCIAVAGLSMNRIKNLKIVKNNLVIVHDNQPRNKEVCNVIEKTISEGYNCVIWPQTIEQKDVNEMVNFNINVVRVIKENTFSGLQAKVKFVGWKRI